MCPNFHDLKHFVIYERHNQINRGFEILNLSEVIVYHRFGAKI